MSLSGRVETLRYSTDFWSGGEEESKRVGVYPPVGEEVACKGMKGKRIDGFPLSHDGNDGGQVY
jgi:hypothetical protein